MGKVLGVGEGGRGRVSVYWGQVGLMGSLYWGKLEEYQHGRREQVTVSESPMCKNGAGSGERERTAAMVQQMGFQPGQS